MKLRLKHYKLTVIITVAVITLSMIPIPEVKSIEDVPFFDKWVHFIMYGAITVAMWLDLKLYNHSISLWYYAAMFLLPSFLGGIMELAQENLTTYRSGDIIDFAADMFGSAFGTITCIFIRLILKQVRK